MAHGLCLTRTMSKYSYYIHANVVYKLMDEFVKQNMVNVHDALREFIKGTLSLRGKFWR